VETVRHRVWEGLLTAVLGLSVMACSSAAPTPSSTPVLTPLAPSLAPTPTATAQQTTSPSPAQPPTATPTSPSPTTTPPPKPTATPAPTLATAGLHWTAPESIDSTATVSDVVVDAAGHLHVAGLVRRGTQGSFQNAIVYLSNSSGAWTQTRVTSWSGYSAPVLAVDRDGTAWLAFAASSVNDCTGCEPGPLYVTNNTSGDWAEPVVVGDGQFDRPSIAVLEGTAHVTYQFAGYECFVGDDEPPATPVPGPNCGVQYATNSNGSWLTSQLDAYTNYPEAAIAAGSDGVVRIAYGHRSGIRSEAYENGVEYLIYGSLNKPGGPRLSSIDAAQNLRGYGGEIQLLLDANDEPIVVLSDTDGYSEGIVKHWLVAPAGDRWTTQQLPVNLPLIRSALTGAGSVHTISFDFYYGSGDEPSGLWYANSADDAPARLADGGVTGADIVADANGTLHVVWSSPSGVWLTSAQSGS